MRNNTVKAGLTLSTLLVLVAATGCTKEAVGTPTPATSAPADPTSGPGTAAPSTPLSAPPVKDPLNADKFIESPCTSLTSEQAQTFKITKPGTADFRISPGCTWSAGTDDSTGVSVSFATNVKNGLSNLYNQNAAGWYKNGYFEPTEIDGYPAVYTDSSDRRPQGDCTLQVGIRNELFYEVLIQGPAGTPACKAALNVATEVLKTVKGSH